MESPTPWFPTPVQAPPAPDHEQPAPSPIRQRKRPLHKRQLGAVLAAIVAFLAKFKAIILLPVLPLDGGRAMAAMAPWMWFLGFAAMIPLAIVFPNPIILLILVFAGYETYKRWRLRKAGGEQQRAYYRVRPLDRALVAAVYLSLIALLVVGMDATHLPRTFS